MYFTPSHFLKIHLNIILSFSVWSPKWAFTFTFPTKTFLAFLISNLPDHDLPITLFLDLISLVRFSGLKVMDHLIRICLPFNCYFFLSVRGELSYLAPLGSENISAPYFKQCFFRGGGVLPAQTESNTTPPSPKTEITNISFYILNFASIIKFKM